MSAAGHEHDPREAYIQRIVDAAPPLSDEQRHRVAALLRPVAARLDSDAEATTKKRSA